MLASPVCDEADESVPVRGQQTSQQEKRPCLVAPSPVSLAVERCSSKVRNHDLLLLSVAILLRLARATNQPALTQPRPVIPHPCAVGAAFLAHALASCRPRHEAGCRRTGPAADNCRKRLKNQCFRGPPGPRPRPRPGRRFASQMDSVGLHDGYMSPSMSLCAVHSTATRVSCCRLRPPTLGLHPPSTCANMTGPSTASQPNVR